MDISTSDLTKQFKAALKRWPFLPELEQKHGLLPFLMFAVGSRETNLSAAFTEGTTGDFGHGHGVWQLDDRFHVIPSGFDTDVHAQAQTAAEMLADLRRRQGNWLAACNAYNSGSPLTENTTNQNYGPDVLERQATLVALAREQGIARLIPPLEDADDAEMFIADIRGLDHPQLIGAGWRKSIRSGKTAEALLKAGVKHLGVLDRSVGADLIDIETVPALLEKVAGAVANTSPESG